MSTYTGSHKPANDRERRKWQNPEAILADIGLKPGHTFVDIGCGGGFFALPAARIVGEKGKVYGLDADSHSISALAKLAAKENLDNLKLTVDRAEEAVLCQACADIVFFGIVLHDFADAARVLVNAKKMLKSTGQLINLDWKKEPMELGPPLPKRFSEEYALHLIEQAGFVAETVKEVGLYHYLIIARPNSSI